MALADLDMTVLDANAAFAKFLGRDGRRHRGPEHRRLQPSPSDMLVQRRPARGAARRRDGALHDREALPARRRHARAGRGDRLARPRRPRPRRSPCSPRSSDISEQRRAVEALDRRARYSEAAAELGRIALVAADMSELAERLAEVVAERLGADTCQITEVDGVELHCLAVHGADIGRSQGERWTMRERSLAGLVFGTDGPLVVEDLANERARRVGEAARLGHAQRDGRLGRGPRRPGRHGRGVQPLAAQLDARGVVVPARRRQRHGLGDRARRRARRRPSTARCTTR